MASLIRTDGLDQAYRERTGRSKARPPRWDVGSRRYLDTTLQSKHFESCPYQAMLDLVDFFDFLHLGIGQTNSAVELAIDADVDIFVHCRAEHCAAVTSVKA